MRFTRLQLLNTPSSAEDFRRSVLYLLVKLSDRNNLLPRSLFLDDARLGFNGDAVAGGRFADIYRGLLDTQVVAIKRMRVFGNDESARCRKAGVPRVFCWDIADIERQMLHKEAIVWRQLQHPHVLPFLGLGQKIFSDNNRICMVSPWMDNGTLCHFVSSESYIAKEDCIRLVRDNVYCSAHQDAMTFIQMSELASGLSYLHSHKVVHGDLHGVCCYLCSGFISLRLCSG
jgi:serine/threonine protein kinase